MSFLQKLIPVAGILCTAMLLGILDNTLVSGWILLPAAALLTLLLCGLGLWLQLPLDLLQCAGASAILLFLAFYGNAYLPLSSYPVTLPVQARGCNGCSKPDPAAHRYYVVVSFKGKNLELYSYHADLAREADSCRITVTKGLLGLEFVGKWHLDYD